MIGTPGVRQSGIVARMPSVLAVNTGSSTVKFGAFETAGGTLAPVLRGRIESHGPGRRVLSLDTDGVVLTEAPWVDRGRDTAPDLLRWVEARLAGPVAGVGHRIVHGGPDFSQAVAATEPVLKALDALAPLAPLHQQQGLAGAWALRKSHPDLPQVLTFDTAFHGGHEPVADRLGLPRVWEARGLRRYGFHGLSYESVAEQLALLDPSTATGRVVTAHLGSGASLCALRNGRSVDSTMGATPLDGMVMGTRCGSLDPGVVLYLQQIAGLDAAELVDLLYRRSGLLGVSGLSGDMRVLLESDDLAAREAVDLFVYRAAREVATLAGSVEGLDGLVFTAGIGENSPRIRAEICARLAWLGVELDPAANSRGTGQLSAAGSPVTGWMIRTDEERMIARHASRLLGLDR
ncbi:acetate/propionate family kinase [uncultured Brevundimonas sp.]|uniref:acetate/propionate family kinase n=1 Tax=uncultured Brevundimonas sp. TaxID=213418 RepID=UPI0030EC5E6F|tara:strand:+ start:56702 stop:57916 length:1215 start_codon:yes stop_codon:yes gene_type:complete